MRWVDAFIDVPEDETERAGTFWSEALGWPLGSPWTGHPEFRSFAPDEGDEYVHRQTINGPARIHIDLEVLDVDAEAERLVTLGAQKVHRAKHWQVMASPGGLPFCLCLGSASHRSKSQPAAMTWDTGHRSRLVQICIDAPSRIHETETKFWRDATGWTFSETRRPEFDGRLRPGERGPLQILLQQLGPDDDGEHTRAHLDLGTDDVDAEVARLLRLGAQRVATGSGWIVMQDPVGLPFCVTSNPPD